MSGQSRTMTCWSNSRVEELLGTMKFIAAGVLWGHEHLHWFAAALLVFGAFDFLASIYYGVMENNDEQRHRHAGKADDRKVDRS